MAAIGVLHLVSSGIYRLPLPMRATPGHVNSYLLVDEDSCVFYDTGHNTAETRAIWENVLGQEILRKDVSKIVLSHTHPDHVGSADWLSRRTGAQVCLARAESDALHGLSDYSAEDAAAFIASFRRWGIPDDGCTKIVSALRRYSKGCPPLAATTSPLDNNADFHAAGRNWRVVHGYGHTSANAALLDVHNGTLICGDQILPDIYPSIGIWWGLSGNPLHDYLESLKTFYALPVQWALPSHGEPFANIAVRIDEIRRFYYRELKRVLDICTQSSCAPYDRILMSLSEKNTNSSFTLISGQTLAIFAFLEAAGLLERVEETPRFLSCRGGEEMLPLLLGLAPIGSDILMPLHHPTREMPELSN